ncbi:hypothetical protein [Streptomyces sp. MZ04]|uniref:hypothetical protein n=1 Tax=Streptomyces sp. MZ04 TaxID=2559236 RepID=UPI00107ED6D9|nr:hypothetical protein [Streptomyces sp. MZ04]TGB02984.1 hypothetical protein E2651_26470 [Streptomyces sp. MZ04]
MRPIDPEEAASVMRAGGLNPIPPYPGSNSPWPSRCIAHGHEVAPKYSRVKGAVAAGKTTACQQCAATERGRRRRAGLMAAAEADMRAAGLEPREPYPGTSKPWRCTCTRCGQEVETYHANVKAGRDGCVSCARKRAGANRRAHAEESAVAAMRLAGWEPQEPYPASDKPWRCRCKGCGRIGHPLHSNARTSMGYGCKSCAIKAMHRRRNTRDAAAVLADIRAAGIEPAGPPPDLPETPWLCHCTTCGHAVDIAPADAHPGNGCPRCAADNTDRERRQRATDAAATVRAAGFEPADAYPDDETARWACECTTCGQLVRITVRLARKGQGCPECNRRSGIEKRRGRHRLTDEEATSRATAAGYDPEEAYPGANNRHWRVRHRACGNVVVKTLANISTPVNAGCPACAKNRPTDPDRAEEAFSAYGFTPNAPWVGSVDRGWPSTCDECGADCSPSLTNLRRGQGGCSACTKYGLDPGGPARLYVIEHDGHGATKIGITGSDATGERTHDRVAWFQARGWRLHTAHAFATGTQARAVERAVLLRFRLAGHKRFLGPHQCSSGWTETFDREEVSVQDLAGSAQDEREQLEGIMPGHRGRGGFNGGFGWRVGTGQ